ncbi:MAG: RimK family alpha-L-glutamate ligase [Candidatus Aenigmarchaeota archaeon]|nr:RimK family alpha-L-glutamate ligase [Candidatus Aenigmarchaeota archaeon]
MAKKRLCILGSKIPEFEEKMLLKEAKGLFGASYVRLPDVRIESRKNVRIMAGNANLLMTDAVLPRIEWQHVQYGYAILKLLENRVAIPNTPESLPIVHDKFLTLLYLHAAGIPVPETYLASTRTAVEDILERIQYPVIIKLLMGGEGKGVMKAESKSSAMALIDTIERIRQPIFIEEYLEGGHEDIRAMVIGDEVVAAMKRIAPTGDFRANISGGGHGEKIDLDSRMTNLALKAARAIGIEITGVDIIETNRGPKIVEVNYKPQFSGLMKATGVNVARLMVEYMYKKVRDL